MDFSKIEQKTEAFCHLVHPAEGPLYETDKDGKPDLDQPVGIYHTSTDSANYRRKMEEMFRRRTGKAAKAQKSLAEIEADEIELASAACTRAQNIKHGGKEPKSEADFVAFFTEHKWAMKQLRQSLSDDANFF